MNEQEFDKKWDKVYQQRVVQGHEEPSPETRERLSVLETNNQNIMEYLKENKEEHKELFKGVAEIKKSIDTLPEKLDQRYASKDTEISLKRLNWIVITAVVTTLLAVVIKVQ